MGFFFQITFYSCYEYECSHAVAGTIDTHEIMESFRKLGISVDKAEAQRLLQR